jgi:hypothetical protein
MHNPGRHYGIEQVCEAGPVNMWGTCASKVRAGHKCGRPAVGHRDLVGQYPKGLTRDGISLAVSSSGPRVADNRQTVLTG